jgi:hypothetical protein
MTKLGVYFFVLMFAVSASGQSFEPYGGNVPKTFYDLISGDAGQKRDWDKLRRLFHKSAKIVLAGSNSNETKTLSVEDYIKTLEMEIGKDGYWIAEIDNRTQETGKLMHVFSTFSVNKKLNEVPISYGVVSFQLISEGNRCYIVSLLLQTKTNFSAKTENEPNRTGFLILQGRRTLSFEILPITNVTDVILSKDQIILSCSSEKTINVSTKATNENNDQLLYNYVLTGGKIIGNGEKVIWDLSSEKPGTYTITAATDNGCGLCGTTVTKTVTVVETGDCPK